MVAVTSTLGRSSPAATDRSGRPSGGKLRPSSLLVGRAAVGLPAGSGELTALCPLGYGRAVALPLPLQCDLAGLLDGAEEAADGPPGTADPVHLLRHRSAAVGQPAVRVHRAERLVHLDELA